MSFGERSFDYCCIRHFYHNSLFAFLVYTVLFFLIKIQLYSYWFHFQCFTIKKDCFRMTETVFSYHL